MLANPGLCTAEQNRRKDGWRPCPSLARGMETALSGRSWLRRRAAQLGYGLDLSLEIKLT